jgi:drug/metabolite transporter (DMT)-like permease
MAAGRRDPHGRADGEPALMSHPRWAQVLLFVVPGLLLHERMSGAQRVAVLAALAGVLFVIARGDIGNPLAVRFSAGDGWIVAAALPGVLSCGAYSFLQREPGAARTALMLCLAPVYGALPAWRLLGERPGWYHVVGGALILPGIRPATRAASATR